MSIRRYKWDGNFTAGELQKQIPSTVTPTILGTNPTYSDIELLPDPVSADTAADLDAYMATLGWSFVGENPTTPLAPIEILFQPVFNNDKGDYKVDYLAAGGSSFFSFRIPWDFVKLDKLVMLAIPNNTSSSGDMDLSSDYGKVGEPYNAHSESNAAVPFVGTADELVEIDISSVFSALEAGDACGLFLDQNGITGGVNYLGILLQYSNT